jgi:uncharacterized protein YlxP (DUF503 family)
MIVGVLKLVLVIPQSHSLKDKRQVLRKIKDKVMAKYQVSIAEVADNDLWQRVTLGVSVVGNDSDYIHSCLDNVRQTIDQLYVAEMVDAYKELISFKD